ncbi:MAG: helix-turn-helix transcriptional regulator [Bacteroidetes bacterium]|nr:helix-turn-helix transcriptional regulator [Bacteroidota bacterium]
MSISPDTYKKVVAAKVYIDGNFQGPVDLERLSREACLSRYHFHRLFTRIYRLTPHQYLTRKRIEQARLCLAARELTVTEICNRVGFESIGSFSLLFKKEMGAPPTNYRDEAWRKEQQTLEQPRSFIPHCFLEHCGVDPAADTAASDFIRCDAAASGSSSPDVAQKSNSQ